jgi:hypothetical protein
LKWNKNIYSSFQRAEWPPHNDCIAQSGGVGWHHNRKRKMLSVRISAAVRMERSREARYNNKMRGHREAEGRGIRIKVPRSNSSLSLQDRSEAPELQVMGRA